MGLLGMLGPTLTLLLRCSEEGRDHEAMVPGGSSTAGEWYLEGAAL